MKYFYRAIIFFFFVSCEHKPTRISFYYWKTIFRINPLEKETLKNNQVTTLYVRYCDIDFPAGASVPQPVSPIILDSSVRNYQVVPVVFIKNRTFERLDSAGVVELSAKLFSFVSQLSNSQNIHPSTIQFDCDWTERTKNNYFLFLKLYRGVSKQPVSATIRLHQVKYPERTGIPPVDHGVLMYYNMGNINAGTENSIYEPSIANKYNSFIASYPLQLDIALPVFSWGLKIRDGKVVELLNKIYFSHFENDSNFRLVRKDWFVARHACFKAGYYFAEGDAVKIERVTGSDLLEMGRQIRYNSNNKIRDLLFYELDSANIVQYEKDIFKKVLDRID